MHRYKFPLNIFSKLTLDNYFEKKINTHRVLDHGSDNITHLIENYRLNSIFVK